MSRPPDLHGDPMRIPMRRRMRRTPPRGLPSATRGFTLLELLIAAALLAVLAVLSWRGLDSVLVARERIVATSDELRSLTMAFAQMDEDLRRSWPVRLLRLPAPSIGFSVAGERAQPTLELLRETSAANEPTQVQQVAYRLRDGVLERGFGPWTSPAAAPQGGTAGLVWQPILGGVSDVDMQGWLSDQGWIPARALAGKLTGPGAVQGPQGAQGRQAEPPAALTGLQVVIRRQDGSEFVRIFPVKD
jgi:general secretion pathway protein J